MEIMEIYRSVGGSVRYEMFQSFQVLTLKCGGKISLEH